MFHLSELILITANITNTRPDASINGCFCQNVCIVNQQFAIKYSNLL